MKLELAFASLFVATTAYAQAPGDYTGDHSGEYAEGAAAPGMVAPVVVAPVVVAPPKPRRWSVGLGLGSLSLAPHDAPDVESEFGIGQLAVRYRATRHLEIELAFAGGREQLGDGQEGDREVSQGVLALRYRFSPQRRWNWWLMAGMGSLAVTRHEASEQEHEHAQQSTLQLGVGLERRWHRFALQLELRAVGVKANEGDDAPVVGTFDPEPGAPVQMTTTGGGMAGGQVVFTGNYYF